jgi:hypothetical protein
MQFQMKNSILKFNVFSALLLLLSACSEGNKTPEQIASERRLYAVSMTQNAFEQTLREPSSVQYITKAYNRSNDALCIKYRARNGFGGMAIGYLVVINEKVQDTPSSFAKNCQGDLENYTF